jgi:hypothetical protein
MLELEEDVYHSRHKGQKEMHFMVPPPMGSNQAELARLRENQKKLMHALQRLFNLLERYAPSWYTEEHHDTASAALSATLDTNRKRRVTFLQRKIR